MKQTDILYLGRTNLNPGVATRQTFDFPLGSLYQAIMLDIRGQLVVSGSSISGYTAFENPILELINKIELKADLDGVIVNAPSKALYYFFANKYGTLPRKSETVNLNSAGTYNLSVHIPLIFIDERMARPEDTILDTSRYSNLELYISLGNATDVIKTAGTGGTYSLQNFYCDVELMKIDRRDSMLPLFLPRFEVEESYKSIGSVSVINFSRSSDRALKRFMAMTTNCGSSVIPSRNFQGDKSSSIVDKFTFRDESKNYLYNRSDEAIMNEMKLLLGWDENLPAGTYFFDLVKDGSNLSALATGDKSTLALEWQVDSSAPSGNKIVSVVSESLIALK